jgi:hypothetical protein
MENPVLQKSAEQHYFRRWRIIGESADRNKQRCWLTPLSSCTTVRLRVHGVN